MDTWNPWHGCRKISEGCRHCYVYRMDGRFEKDASAIRKTSFFNLPVQRDRYRHFKLANPGSYIFTCGTSDFFLEEADEWRKEAWEMIRYRKDQKFLIITKRIDRFTVNLPDDWGEGYDHVYIGSTTENQAMADYRLPIFTALPIQHRIIICEPLLEKIDIRQPLSTGGIEQVIAGGESGQEARVCDFDWVTDLHRQCAATDTAFTFRQTGRYFRKEGKLYDIPRSQQFGQARKSGMKLTNGKGL